jgi:hypothetical protein
VLRAALRLLDEPKNCLRALPGKSTVCTLSGSLTPTGPWDCLIAARQTCEGNSAKAGRGLCHPTRPYFCHCEQPDPSDRRRKALPHA